VVHSTRDRALAILSRLSLACDQTDAQLLARFATGHDEAAFEALLRRHGGLVWGVCRRALGHEHDAEDAFQATFLVLAKQAAQIRKPEALVSWLYGTALRMARRAKRDMTRRHHHEQRAGRPASVEAVPEAGLRELQAVLDEEVERLPEKYRTAFTLCVLDGHTREEAAAALGCEPGTVAVHLHRARQRLQKQLARRGVALSAALTAASLGETAFATAPAAVLTATLQAVRGPLGAVSARVAVLLQGATAATLSTKQKLAGLLLLAASLAVAGALLPRVPAQSGPVAAVNAEPEPVARPMPPPVEKEKKTEVRGRVLGPDGKPIEGAAVRLAVWKSEEEQVTLIATTDADGRFQGSVPALKTGQVETRSLVAFAPGFGADWIDLDAVPSGDEITLRLVKADVVVRGRVLTLEGKPVAGATVWVWHVVTTEKEDLSPVFKLWPEDPYQALNEARKGLHYPPAAGLPRKLTTDAEGRFEVRGAGDSRLLSLRIEGDTIEHTYIRVATVKDFDPKTFAPSGKQPRPPRPVQPAQGGPPLYGPTFDHAARPTQVVTGVVRDRKTGKPVANVGITGTVAYGWWENSAFTRTDAEGRYRLVGLPKSPDCRLTYRHADASTEYLGLVRTVPEADGLAPVTLDVEMVRGTVVTGRVTDKETEKPVAGRVRYVPLKGNKELAKLPGADIHLNGSLTYGLDDEGRFRLVAPPGPGVVMVQAERRAVGARPYTQAFVRPADRKEPYFQEHDGLGDIFLSADRGLEPLVDKNAYRIIEPAEGAEALTVDIALDPGKTVTGRVVDPDGNAVRGTTVVGLQGGWDPVTWLDLAFRDKDRPTTVGLQDGGDQGGLIRDGATFTAVALDPEHPRLLLAIHPGRKLGGTLLLRGDEKEPPVLRLQKWGALTGRVLGVDGKPTAGLRLRYRFLDRSVWMAYRLFPEEPSVFTDADGRFRLDVPFAQQELLLVLPRDTRGAGTPRPLRPEALTPGQVKDLGDIRLGAPEK
jgi:RNA polymerase sigma factor (sigma-70 family)